MQQTSKKQKTERRPPTPLFLVNLSGLVALLFTRMDVLIPSLRGLERESNNLKRHS
jgi:hypothetical protein